MPKKEKIKHIKPQDYVFMVHGFLGSKFLFLPLKWRLEKNSYKIITWGHTSLFYSIKTYAEKLEQDVLKLISKKRVGKIHFIGHSMGAIIVRTALQQISVSLPPWQHGKIVLIAPPNKGSWVPKYCPEIVRKTIKPVEELSDHPNSFVNKLPKTIPFQTGILLAKTDHLIIPEATKIDTVKEIKEVRGLHQTILYKKETARYIINFLKKGKFE